jgi:hypothetical protein
MQTKMTSMHSVKEKKYGPGIWDGRKFYFCEVNETGA